MISHKTTGIRAWRNQSKMDKFIFIVVESKAYEGSEILFVGDLQGVNDFTGNHLMMEDFDKAEENDIVTWRHCSVSITTDEDYDYNVTKDVYRIEFNKTPHQKLFL